jgi:hypothetical protein
LSPLDPRFLELTSEDVETEFWAYHYADKPPGEEYEDDDFDVQALLEGLNGNDDDWEELINDS